MKKKKVEPNNEVSEAAEIKVTESDGDISSVLMQVHSILERHTGIPQNYLYM